MDSEEYRKKIELDILKIIEEKLANGQMDTERAKAIARMVLDKLHPPLTLEQIYQIVPTLDDHFTELAQAVLPVIQEHDKTISTIVSEHAEKLIKMGKIDEANTILKQATNKNNSMQKGQAPTLILVGILIIAILTSGVYYLGRQISSKPQFSPIPSPINQTLSWKTYTNKSLGIEFKYPISVNDSYKGGGEFPPFMTVAFPIEAGDVAQKQMLIFYDTGKSSPSELADIHINQEQSNNVNITKQTIKIGGVSGIKLTYYYKKLDTGKTIIFIANSPLIFQMSINYLSKNKDMTLTLLDQFLTNFKFLK